MGSNSAELTIFSLKEKVSRTGGINFLLSKDQTMTYDINKNARKIPGIIPATKSFDIDSSTVTP